MTTLANSTGDAAIDVQITAIISIYETAFPQRIRGYYLVGSYGDDTPIAGSDVDMTIVFKDAISPDEQAQCDTLKAACRTLAEPRHLDLPVIAEAHFEQADTVALKLSSKFVYGDDTRSTIPLPTMDVYLRNISIPTQRGLTYRFRSETVILPLDYPLPDDVYLGYIPEAHQATNTPIKLWALNVGWLATFLVVHKAQVYVPSKRHMVRLYREHVNDEWTDFIVAVYENGRNKWGYKIPQDDEDDALFQSLLKDTLAFENYVAQEYVAYLQAEIKTNDAESTEIRLNAFKLDN